MDSRIMRSVWIVFVVLAAMLLLVACGSTPEPTATPVPAEPTQPPPEPTEAPAAVEPTAPPEAEALFPAEMPSVARGKEIYTAN